MVLRDPVGQKEAVCFQMHVFDLGVVVVVVENHENDAAVQQLVCLFVCSFVCLFACLLACLFVCLFVCSLVCSCVLVCLCFG